MVLHFIKTDDDCGTAWGGGKLACAHGGSRMSISQTPSPLLARRDGAVTTGIHSPPVPPPYPQRWWYLCPVYSGCIP